MQTRHHRVIAVTAVRREMLPLAAFRGAGGCKAPARSDAVHRHRRNGLRLEAGGSLWAMTAYHARFSNAGRRGRCRSSPRGGAPPPRIARPLRVGDARAVAVEGRARRTARVAPSSRCRGRRRARGGAGRKERGELHVAHVGARRHQGRGAAPAGRAELAARHGRDAPPANGKEEQEVEEGRPRCASSLDSTRDASWKKKTLTAAFPDDDAAAGAVHPVHGATRPHDRYGCARLQNGRQAGI